MKKITILLLISMTLILSCTEKDVLNTYDSTKPIESKADFYSMIEQNIYPTNKLSKETVEQFAESLIFDENKYLRGFNYLMITEDLNEADYNVFIQQILQQNAYAYGDKVYAELKSYINPYNNPGLPNGDKWLIHQSPRVGSGGNNWSCTYSIYDICRNPAIIIYDGGNGNNN